VLSKLISSSTKAEKYCPNIQQASFGISKGLFIGFYSLVERER
jgi:hypothetical protein